jgi:hypothetical protein
VFNSTIFDVAFGLVSVFLAISLFTSALTEAVSTIFALRASTLLTGVKQLLNDPKLDGLALDLYNHALVNPLSNGITTKGGKPAVQRRLNSRSARSLIRRSRRPCRRFIGGRTEKPTPSTTRSHSGSTVRWAA